MELSKEEISDFKEEIIELTELLNSEWEDLKEILSKNLDITGAYLCSYGEYETSGEYGIILTQQKEIYEFSITERYTSVTRVENVKEIEQDYPQILVAMNM